MPIATRWFKPKEWKMVLRLLALRVCIMAALLAMLSATMAQSFDLPPRKASPLTVMQIHSGHSLSDTYGSGPWPGRLIMATAAVSTGDPNKTIFRSIIPGSPLRWRWDHPTDYPDARRDIRDFALLVITEAVPLSADPATFASDNLFWFDRWVANAGENGNGGRGAEVMLYSTWISWRPSEDSPKTASKVDLRFRESMEVEGKRWEAMQDHANANRPSGMKPIYMIPGHRLILQIYDDISAGRAPGLTAISDLFLDDIHLNDLGQYAVTCLVYATIYQRNPAELPDKLIAEADTLTAEQARYFKNLAWTVARSYARSGVP
jgi:hypothetical protein